MPPTRRIRTAPVPSTYRRRVASREKTLVAGRTVVHAVGQKTQTVRIHHAAPRAGVEVGYRLPVTAEVSVGLMAEFTDVDALRDWLVERGGTLLDDPAASGSAVEPLVEVLPEDEGWIADAVPRVELAIRALVDGFLANPYLHRVEHSLHAELFSLLKEHELLAARQALRDGLTTQLVHKEWPETRPQPHKGGGRGLFDLVVLAPTQLARASRQQFRDGRIEAPIVVELGLDYGLTHLRGDDEKFRNSRVRHPYLVHLARASTARVAEVEKFIARVEAPVQVAYAHLHPGTGATRHRHVGTVSVTT
ncbi:hypothetical protein Krad_4397 [Kineococcus radiotolerans SRS30216 = ATCC BAA-149]|uniref:Uncharacterized protein n=1 Tax=Kineococcus radiotolerans (strain ATCC BAA-149 / DSM 14245 / SRS30216) TaxID=266940 RepID=A6WGB7_KINRD|nr:hypothetical protein Krad_4397 [Kineococcus radiotolerans SRS30216 = ATCC BAA-149]